MKFTKMHGAGNDYIYVNGLAENTEKLTAETIIRLSDRHFGIGSDGVIVILPSAVADFRMRMFNADGSEGRMCGNGIRCVAKFVYDHGMTDKTTLRIETLAGVKTLFLHTENGRVRTVRVDMGEPVLAPAEIPMTVGGADAVGVPVEVAGRALRLTGVSMGNPHAVVFVDDVENFPVEKIGSECENLAIFPERVNTEFVEIVDRRHVRMRVWERGSGETLACGTGTCATLVAAVLNGLTERQVTVGVPGGEIEVEWSVADNHVYMTGPAETVFEGEIEI